MVMLSPPVQAAAVRHGGRLGAGVRRRGSKLSLTIEESKRFPKLYNDN